MLVSIAAALEAGPEQVFEHARRTLQVLRVAVQLALLDVVPYQLLHGLLDTFGLVGLIVER